MPTKIISQFHKGMSEDINYHQDGFFGIAKNFDIYTNQSKITPNRVTEDDSGGTQYRVGFIIPGTGTQIWGLGTESAASSKAAVYLKTDINEAWTTPNDNIALAGVAGDNLFINYKNYLYFFCGSNQIARYGDITNTATAALTENFATPTYTTGGPGIIGLDDILYIAYDNILASTDAGAALAVGLTLPSDLLIVSLALWQTYIVVGARPKNTYNNKSYLIFWDGVSSQPDFWVEIPEGTLTVVRNVGDRLVALSHNFAINSSGKTDFFIWNWGGGNIKLDKAYRMAGISGWSAPKDKTTDVRGGNMYVGMKFNGEIGAYCYGRKNSAQDYAFNLDRFMTAGNTETSVINLKMMSEYLFGVHTAVGTIVKTNDQGVYGSATAIIELDYVGNPYESNVLEEVNLIFDPIPANNTFAMDYRKNEETSWTAITAPSIATNDIKINFERIGIEFRKIQLRVKVTVVASAVPPDLRAVYIKTQKLID